MLEHAKNDAVAGRRADAERLAPYVRFGAHDAPENDLPRFGHRQSSDSRTIGACFRQGYDITFVAPRDVLIVFMNGFQAVEAIDGDSVDGSALPGDMRWHPAGTLVQAKTDDVVAELAGISVDPDLREETVDHMGLFGARRSSLDHYARKNGSALAMRLAQQIRRDMLARSAVDALAVDELCIDMLKASVSLITGQSSEAAKAPRLHRAQLARTTEYIEAHLAENLCMKDVARQCHFTQPHFTTAFKRTTGLTPYQYLLERRIAHTREMLLTSELSTAAVAYDCGFSSQAHMTVLFKKKVGLTPAKFRKVHKPLVHAVRGLH